MRPRASREGILCGLILAVLFLAPLPMGSNRAFMWLGWAAIFFAIVGIYLVHAGWRSQEPSVPLADIWIPVITASVFGGWGAFQALVLSVAPGATLLAVLRWGTYCAFFYLCLQVVARSGRMRHLAWGALMAATFHASVGLVALRYLGDIAPWGAKLAYEGVATGGFVNRNVFGAYLAMGAILGTGLATRSLRTGGNWTQDPLPTAAAGLMTCIILIALFATGSRLALISTLAGASSVLVASSGVRGWKLAGMIGIVLTGASVGALLLGSPVVERAVLGGADVVQRLDLYWQVVELVMSQPIAGHGLDAFEIAFQEVRRPPVSTDVLWDRGHSTLLTLWAEAGVIVGSLPPVICAIIGWRLMGGRQDGLEATALGALVAAGIHALGDFGLEVQAVVFQFLAILALGLSEKLGVDPKVAGPPRNGGSSPNRTRLPGRRGNHAAQTLTRAPSCGLLQKKPGHSGASR